MLSKISKSLVRSVVRANQVGIISKLNHNSLLNCSTTHIIFDYSKLLASLQEVSPVLTKTRMPLERVPLIKIMGKNHSL